MILYVVHVPRPDQRKPRASGDDPECADGHDDDRQ